LPSQNRIQYNLQRKHSNRLRVYWKSPRTGVRTNTTPIDWVLRTDCCRFGTKPKQLISIIIIAFGIFSAIGAFIAAASKIYDPSKKGLNKLTYPGAFFILCAVVLVLLPAFQNWLTENAQKKDQDNRDRKLKTEYDNSLKSMKSEFDKSNKNIRNRTTRSS